VQTLEVEVRSKFQTERRMEDAAQGEPVEVPFDQALVRYLWRGEREFQVLSVQLRRHSKAELGAPDGERDGAVASGGSQRSAASEEGDVSPAVEGASGEAEGGEDFVDAGAF
jgi:hypothetical protein